MFGGGTLICIQMNALSIQMNALSIRSGRFQWCNFWRAKNWAASITLLLQCVYIHRCQGRAGLVHFSCSEANCIPSHTGKTKCRQLVYETDIFLPCLSLMQGLLQNCFNPIFALEIRAFTCFLDPAGKWRCIGLIERGYKSETNLSTWSRSDIYSSEWEREREVGEAQGETHYLLLPSPPPPPPFNYTQHHQQQLLYYYWVNAVWLTVSRSSLSASSVYTTRLIMSSIKTTRQIILLYQIVFQIFFKETVERAARHSCYPSDARPAVRGCLHSSWKWTLLLRPFVCTQCCHMLHKI